MFGNDMHKYNIYAPLKSHIAENCSLSEIYFSRNEHREKAWLTNGLNCQSFAGSYFFSCVTQPERSDMKFPKY